MVSLLNFVSIIKHESQSTFLPYSKTQIKKFPGGCEGLDTMTMLNLSVQNYFWNTAPDSELTTSIITVVCYILYY